MNLARVKKPLTLSIATAVALSSNANANKLEELIVTAQKRAENNQEVPIAVTAMNAEMLEDAGITNVTGVAYRTPNLSMGEFNPAQPQIYIRGIGSNGDGAASGEQSVAMFIDGVYVNRSAGAGLELFDIETIEVLRGPQGTLWGKNAIAGAINVTTKKPSDELDAAVEVTAGNLGLKNLRSYISGPIADAINGKLSINAKQRDAYVTSVYDPEIEQGSIDSKGARAQLQFLPTDRLEFLWTVNYNEDSRDGAASIADENEGISGAVLSAAIAEGLPVADFHENYADVQGDTELQSQGTSLQIDWELDYFSITSLTSYSELQTDIFQGLLGISSDIFYEYGPFSQGVLGPYAGLEFLNVIDEESSMLTQEIRFSGESDRWTWQTGLYFASEEVDRTEGSLLNAPAFLMASLGPELALAYSPSFDRAIQANTTTSYAAFGQATFRITDAWDITAGLRYTEETKDYSNTSIMTPLEDSTQPELIDSFSGENTWSAPTYKLVTNYHFADEAMVYLSAASGFKSGGYNYSSTLSPSVGEPFNEENAVNYELGLKSTWFDSTLRANAAIFHTEYTDLQVLQQFLCDDCTIAPLVTKNAGEALSEGVELELTYLLGDHLTFTGSYAYLDARYTELEGVLAQDVGNFLRNAPRNTFNAAVNYMTDLSFGGSMKARLEYVHKEKAYQDTSNYEYSAIPEYRFYDARLAYTSPGESWELALWGKNIFDEEYYLHNYQAPPFGAIHIPATGANYGLTFTWKTP